MKKLILFLSFISFAFCENFIENLKKDLELELEKEQQRLEEFKKDFSSQNAKLNALKNEIAKQNAIFEKLDNEFKKNEKILQEKEEKLNENLGDLTQVTNVIKRTSAKVQNVMKKTHIRKNYDLFSSLATKKNITSNDIKAFYLALSEMIIDADEISTQKLEIVGKNNKKSLQDVHFVGKFAAFSDEGYLKLNDELNSFLLLQNQNKKADFNPKGLSFITLDVSGGELFLMQENEATLFEKIRQGGLVGYIIIFISILGLIHSLIKMIFLRKKFSKTKTQLKNIQNPTDDNPLGVIIKIFNDNKHKAINELETKISQAVIAQSVSIQYGKDVIKLFATVTPLLGLLGTVTGMITTFETITMFGTGDAKLMADGISSALVTTVLGLVGAIPLLFAYAYVNSKANEILSILEEQSIGMLAQSFCDE